MLWGPPPLDCFHRSSFHEVFARDEKEKVLFESSSRENVQFPEIGLESQCVQRCQGSTYSVSSWRAEKLSQRTPKQRWAEQNLWPTMARVWILLQNIALQQFPLLLLPYSEGCPFWNYKLLPASFESHPFLNCKCKLQIVTCACLFWGAPPSTPSLWGVKAFAQQGARGSHPGNRAI